MRIEDNGLLVMEAGELPPIVQKTSPNCTPGLKPEDVKFIVAHWTGGSSLSSAMGWLSNPAAAASAHFVIGRDGQIGQLVPTGKIAWHAGTSAWKTAAGVAYTKLNRYSIGLEFVNLGKLRKTEGNTFVSSTGRVVPADDVVSFVKNGTFSYYQVFPHDQLMAGLNLMAAIKTKFSAVEDVIGHMDIAPERKIDPGPVFPMDWYRAKLFGARGDGELVA